MREVKGEELQREREQKQWSLRKALNYFPIKKVTAPQTECCSHQHLEQFESCYDKCKLKKILMSNGAGILQNQEKFHLEIREKYCFDLIHSSRFPFLI